MTSGNDQLDERELACLACVAEIIIPSSTERSLPSAGDPAIIAMMQSSLDRDRDAFRLALCRVLEASKGRLAAMPTEEQASLLVGLRNRFPDSFAIVESVIAKAYYRDPRVLSALGLRPTPPFPDGYAIDEGDWTLLDPVRARGPVWRNV